MRPEEAAEVLRKMMPQADVSIDSLAVVSAVGALRTRFWTEANKRSKVSYHWYLVPGLTADVAANH